MSTSLIPLLDAMHTGKLVDEYLAVAYTVEQSLMEAGAVPDKDYKILDLYNLAMPIVAERYRKGKIDDELTFPTKELVSG